jgi:site-specific DNA-methyltransferase (adenine-specific)
VTVRVERIGDATLYLGDCLEVMPTLEPVDHVLGDPPYEKEAHRIGRRTMANIRTGENADLTFDAITAEARLDACQKAVPLCRGWLMWFCQAEAAGDWRDALEASKAKYKRTMIWVKPDSSPQFNGQMPAMGYESIPLAWCGSGHPKWNGGGRRGVFTHLTNQPDRDGRHQTEKPGPLMAELVTLFSNPGQTILDPFMGSGSTGVACAKHGRRFVGIEKDPKWFDVACERIEAAYRQPRLFREQPAKVKQDSFLDGAA